MIPCMQRIRKRVRGKNEQTQRCDCLLRCAPECGISILTCGQSLERFLPAFFNKRGKSGCWIPSQASTARSMEWSGGQEGLQGSGPGAGGPVLSVGFAAGTLPPCGRLLKSIRRKKRRKKLPRCSWIRPQTNKRTKEKCRSDFDGTTFLHRSFRNFFRCTRWWRERQNPHRQPA